MKRASFKAPEKDLTTTAPTPVAKTPHQAAAALIVTSSVGFPTI
jgi:hypothetical protein